VRGREKGRREGGRQGGREGERVAIRERLTIEERSGRRRRGQIGETSRARVTVGEHQLAARYFWRVHHDIAMERWRQSSREQLEGRG
jgi:hypothetical protein